MDAYLPPAKPIFGFLPQRSWSRSFIIIAALITGIILGIGLVYYFGSGKTSIPQPDVRQKNSTKADISGVIDFNGTAPAGSNITVSVRKPGDKEFTNAVANIAAADGISWSWNEAVSGSNYELQANLVNGTQTISQSGIIAVTAPAHRETLVLNAKSELLSGQTASISGQLDINGYIPPDATVTLYRYPEGSDTETVKQGIKAADKEKWIWDELPKGTTYAVKAALESGGNQIGVSQTITVTVPAGNEILRINSQLQPPQVPQNTQAVISGKINLNGRVGPNSRIAVFARLSGTDQFKTIADNINPVDGAVWVWNNAQSGAKYDILGIIKVRQSNNNDDDFAYSAQLSVSAPAINEVITLNTAISLQSPQTLPTVSCGMQNNQQQATITLTAMPGAQQYWLQVGTQDGATDVLDTRLNPVSQYQPDINHLVYKVNVGNKTWTYVRYAYSACAACGDLADFSNFSHSQSFICGQ